MNRYIFFLFLFSWNAVLAQPAEDDVKRVLAEINRLRASGCSCGSQWMSPVGPLKWDHSLYRVSNRYARYMARNRHFDHISKEGEDLGDRLDRMGYKWFKIGENLGYGYHEFYSVLAAWKKSPSHCKMLMDPEMTAIGMSKHKLYWVQSFSGVPSHMSSISAY